MDPFLDPLIEVCVRICWIYPPDPRREAYTGDVRTPAELRARMGMGVGMRMVMGMAGFKGLWGVGLGVE